MNDKEKQDHIETMAKMYAEQILALSMQISDAMVKSAIMHGTSIAGNADKMSEVMSTEAIRKAAVKLREDPQ